MTVQGIGGATPITPISFPSLDGTSGTKATTGAGKGFGDSLSGAIGDLQGAQTNSDNLAMQMATGQLTDIQDYMIAANKAEIATQLTVAVKNKAVDAFNQIMNMSV